MTPEPPADCAACPRLAAFRGDNRAARPSYHNAPVAAFGPEDARVLVVGLAPGLHGANRTARPFTGDAAGAVLYPALQRARLARGPFSPDGDDDLTLVGCRITNAVRCVPPDNKPTAAEIRVCRDTYLAPELAALSDLTAIVALGRVAHEAVLAAHGLVKARYPFAHGRTHALPGGRVLADSYHCSRYNMNTGRLTEAMLDAVLTDARARAFGA